jgi:hypothetical protein
MGIQARDLEIQELENRNDVILTLTLPLCPANAGDSRSGTMHAHSAKHSVYVPLDLGWLLDVRAWEHEKVRISDQDDVMFAWIFEAIRSIRTWNSREYDVILEHAHSGIHTPVKQLTNT